MPNKPIVRGFFDPTEIPYYCRRCVHYQNNNSGFPICDKREDGKFLPEIANTCLKLRPVKKESSDD